MKNLIFCSLVFLFLTSCEDDDITRNVRLRGNIYSSIDSMPFKNTQFKVYKQNYIHPDRSITTLFYTDSTGHFDLVITVGDMGDVGWPSYYYGAGYMGPPEFYPLPGKDTVFGNVEQHILEYKVYTKPWH
jgi:hypothetical protein